MPEFILSSAGTVGDPPKRFDDLSELAQGFIEAMFFTECEGSLVDETFDPESGSALPTEAGFADLSEESLAKVLDVCTAFEAEHRALLDEATSKVVDGVAYDLKRAGNDLWYTANGHGVGFWDRRGLGETGTALTKAAKAVGEFSVSWESTAVEGDDDTVADGVVHLD